MLKNISIRRNHEVTCVHLEYILFLTSERVEVDCRGIFKPGQLGVALSRTKTAHDLRIVNFHPRCLFKPPIVVTEFMENEGEEIVKDLSCCGLKNMNIEKAVIM